MLFAVDYVNDGIEDLHGALLFFFEQLRDERITEFGDHLFPESFRAKLYKYNNTELQYKNYVDAVFKPIFNKCRSGELTLEEKKIFIDSFFASNEIGKICDQPNELLPVSFDELNEKVKPALSSFTNLYETLWEICKREDHLEAYETKNGQLCSVCGIKTIYSYDHYFPKGTKYPLYLFSCVNPANLLPICQNCNGSKSSKLILLNAKKARVNVFSPFYPFDIWPVITLDLKLVKNPIVSSPGKWNVSLSWENIDTPLHQKIERWKTFFNIEKRYSRFLKTQVGLWVGLYNERQDSLPVWIERTKPTASTIKSLPGIIIQQQFYVLLNENADIRKLYISTTKISSNPEELLLEQSPP